MNGSDSRSSQTPNSSPTRPANLAARVAMVLIGLFVLGASIAFYVRADVGADPFTVLALGISKRTGATVGVATQLVGAGLLVLLLAIDRRHIGIGTLLNAVLVGGSADIVLRFVPRPLGLLSTVAMAAAAVLMMGMGVGLYVSGRLGEGALEGVMLVASDRLRIPVRLSRMCMDVAAVLVGVALGARIGIGTVLGAALTGPIAEATMRIVEAARNR
ncbi:MAG: YczE/YyaS/YitT family protein [Bacillota bacterium]|jgi:uncharacterized membrane protein YczE